MKIQNRISTVLEHRETHGLTDPGTETPDFQSGSRDFQKPRKGLRHGQVRALDPQNLQRTI